MISEELRAMGLDQDDIEDLKMMAGMMHEFVSIFSLNSILTSRPQLILVPDIETKLEMEAPHDLLDHVQVYTTLTVSWTRVPCHLAFTVLWLSPCHPGFHPAVPARSAQQAGPPRLPRPPPHPGGGGGGEGGGGPRADA